MVFLFNQTEYKFVRYPATSNRSLRPWSAADEHLLQHLDYQEIKPEKLAILSDRFGFLTTILHSHQPFVILNYKSQEKAIHLNLKQNNLTDKMIRFLNPLEKIPSEIETAIIKVPKSLELFQLQLFQLSEALTDNAVVFCSFMTKYFSPQILKIANQFFEKVEQSNAWKKSRVLILQKKKTFQKISIANKIPFQKQTYQQYFGVFSANNIDYATQFFIEHLKPTKENFRVLDLASGNGILARTIQLQIPTNELHLMDDNWLAIESSKLNLKETSFFHYSDSMEIFKDEYFDLVVSNPPFHFENETNIEVAIKLFEEVARCLKPNGSFQLVASKHLNFKTHLIKLFSSVNILAENKKFVIYDCMR